MQFVDFFSGCGGLSSGLEMAGHECLLGVDNNKDSMETFKANHKSADVLSKNINEITEADLRKILGKRFNKIDAVVGGPPCQGFSTIGKGDVKDSRNNLPFEFIRMVRILRPHLVIMENVKGLLSKKNENVLNNIRTALCNAGYFTEVKLLSSDDYGVPQKRQRMILIGAKKKRNILFPEPYIKKRTVNFALAKIEKSIEAGEKIYNHDVETAKPIRDSELKILKHIPEGKGIRYERDEIKYLPKNLRLGVDWATMNEKRFRQTKFQRLDGKNRSFTILTSKKTYYHPTENRHLTVREAATIQSFQLGFKLHGGLSSQWRQIGNAVPPLMAKAIGKLYHGHTF